MLAADCASCFGLCCVVTAFTASGDFAITKPAGTACPNLDAGDGCSIHDRLRPLGFGGCAVYDCFGAGQRLSQETFGGRSWRTDPDVASLMLTAFPVLRDLHESLWYVTDALRHLETPELRSALVELEGWAAMPAQELAALDTLALWPQVEALLVEASRTIRTAAGRGRDLRGVDLAGEDLSGADLSYDDVLGAGLRDADLAGADLTRTLFVTQAQVSSARGDGATRLPASLRRPDHWP